MNSYVTYVQAHPILAAVVQFGLLGTLGEIVAASLQRRRMALGCTFPQLLGKVAAWALLGVVIKYGFTGMRGFTEALLHKGLLPGFLATGVGFAFAMSTLTNVFFGPQMMAFHRLEDNLILRQSGFQGLERALRTLVWFWIPAHTVTFSLPLDYQIGLAALWSVVLGVIMGLSKKPTPAAN